MVDEGFNRNPHGNRADRRSKRIGAAIGKRIDILCSGRGITFADLEKQIGASRGSVAAIVSGRRGTRVSMILIQDLADALDVDVGFLITGRTPEGSSNQKGIKLCGVSLSSELWPPVEPRAVAPLVSAPVARPVSRKKKPRR